MDTKNRYQTAIAVFWVLLVLAFALHSTIAMMPLFYGEDVAVAEIAGQDPNGGMWMMVIIGISFMAFAALATLLTSTLYRWLNFGFAVLATLLNGSHLMEHALESGVEGHTVLFLAFTLLLSLALAVVSFLWAKKPKEA